MESGFNLGIFSSAFSPASSGIVPLCGGAAVALSPQHRFQPGTVRSLTIEPEVPLDPQAEVVPAFEGEYLQLGPISNEATLCAAVVDIRYLRPILRFIPPRLAAYGYVGRDGASYAVIVFSVSQRSWGACEGFRVHAVSTAVDPFSKQSAPKISLLGDGFAVAVGGDKVTRGFENAYDQGDGDIFEQKDTATQPREICERLVRDVLDGKVKVEAVSSGLFKTALATISVAIAQAVLNEPENYSLLALFLRRSGLVPYQIVDPEIRSKLLEIVRSELGLGDFERAVTTRALGDAGCIMTVATLVAHMLGVPRSLVDCSLIPRVLADVAKTGLPKFAHIANSELVLEALRASEEMAGAVYLVLEGSDGRLVIDSFFQEGRGVIQ